MTNACSYGQAALWSHQYTRTLDAFKKSTISLDPTNLLEKTYYTKD